MSVRIDEAIIGRGGTVLHFAFHKPFYGNRLRRVEHDLPRSDRLSAHLFNLFGFEEILKNLEVGDELILVLGIHLNSPHLHVAW